MAQFLVESGLSQGQPLGVSASPVYSLHARVRSILLNRLGPQHAELFAMPVAGANGQISWCTELQGAAKRVSALPEPELEERRVLIWSHPAWAGLLLLLLATFWIGRKLAGAF